MITKAFSLTEDNCRIRAKILRDHGLDAV